MAYTTLAELQAAAGGAAALAEISVNAEAIALAQVTVDGEIDTYAARLHGALPFSADDLSRIKGMAARETVRVLRSFSRIPTAEDLEHRRIFEAWLSALASGTGFPRATDTYPIGTPSVPRVTDRSGVSTTADSSDVGQSRGSLKGWW